MTAVNEAQYKSYFEPTKYIPYLSLAGELWGEFYENLPAL